MERVVVFCWLGCFLAGAERGSYLITGSSIIQPGADYNMNIVILNTTGVEIEATLQENRYNGTSARYDIITLQKVSGVFSKGTTGTLSLPISKDMRCYSCVLNIRGRGGLQFERSLAAHLSRSVVTILVQTDKAIYKPAQTVRFRAFAVYPDLKLYLGNFNIEIRDPSNNKIQVLKGLTSLTGVVEGEMTLSEQPLFGAWTIAVILQDVDDTYSQTFDVADYDLPRFEVKVNLPPYGLLSQSLLTGSVEAKYTFGQPVKGMLELHISPNTGPNSCGALPKTTQIALEIDGTATFSVPKEDIERAVYLYDNTEVKVTAIVKEGSTGVRLNGSSVIQYYEKEHVVKFTDNTPSVFKPGLPYTAYIQVTTPDNMPPASGNHTISVYTYVSYELKVQDQELYGTSQFTGTYPLPGVNLTLPTNGLLPVDIDIPNNATSISIRATFNGVSYNSKSVQKMYSKSNNFIQLTLQEKNVKAKTNATFKIDGTEAINNISFEVLSRGSKVMSDMLDGQGQTSFTFDLEITPSMAPTAHVIAYYAKENDEIIASSLAFNVEGIFQNEVTIAFSKNESEPHDDVDIIIRADPDSQVNFLAVDQSVLLLKSGNDITPEKVNGAITNFDIGEKPKDSEFALTNSAQSVDQVFESTGLAVISDVHMSRLIPVPMTIMPGIANGFGGFAAATTTPFPFPAQNLNADKQSSSKLQEVDRVRNLFPETWHWSFAQVSENGTVVISATVPDTITSWIASAFAVHPESGLGVAAATAKLKVFQAFFVTLTYPNSITRGEQAVIQATIFNYLPTDTNVAVTFKASSSFHSVTVHNDGSEVLETGDRVVNINVHSEEQGVVYFPILAAAIGVANIEVVAQSTVAADAIRKQIIIEPEGAQVSYNYPVFINIDSNSSKEEYKDSIALPLPESVVQGSDRTRIKVTGDLIGPSLDSLEHLIQSPTGCGEQSMVKFSPNLYIALYLKATGQLTNSLRKKLVRYLEAGYQRQLTYQRYDGGFSPFGNFDESGSTWLTAYISRDLSVARHMIYVDPGMLNKAADWLMDRQNKDGSFNEFGKVLDRNIQGTGTGPTLTAQVLLALLENRDLSGEQDCQANENNCQRFYRWNNTTTKAIANLEAQVDNNGLSDIFSQSVVSYALTLAKSPKAGVVFKKLLQSAKVEGGLTYWSANATVPSSGPIQRYATWHPPRIQARPIDILITAYAILTFAASDRLDEAFACVRWLTTQRNSFGGFASTQDTSVALQALSAYASKAITADTALNIRVSNEALLANFTLDNDNSLVLQIQELTSVPPKVNVQATGTGFALLEIDTSFHVNEELMTPSFDVSTVLLDDDVDSFNLMICTKWLWDRQTGMVVQEVRIPSGFQPDLGSLSNVAGLKRSERKGDFVNIYFDEIRKTSLCYSVMMIRTAKVAKSQISYIKTYDYYEPSDQSIVFYQPKKLRDATICDVCDGCCT